MIYISGPMTGHPDLNHKAFINAQACLQASGLPCVSPHEIIADKTKPWIDCMKEDIKELLNCSAIVMLEGWEKSKGAKLERDIAEALGITVYESVGELIGSMGR